MGGSKLPWESRSAITTVTAKSISTSRIFPTITTRSTEMKATRPSLTSAFAPESRHLRFRFWAGAQAFSITITTDCSTYSLPTGMSIRVLIYRTGAQPGRSGRCCCAIWMERNSRRCLRQRAVAWQLLYQHEVRRSVTCSMTAISTSFSTTPALRHWSGSESGQGGDSLAKRGQGRNHDSRSRPLLYREGRQRNRCAVRRWPKRDAQHGCDRNVESRLAIVCLWLLQAVPGMLVAG